MRHRRQFPFLLLGNVLVPILWVLTLPVLIPGIHPVPIGTDMGDGYHVVTCGSAGAPLWPRVLVAITLCWLLVLLISPFILMGRMTYWWYQCRRRRADKARSTKPAM